MTAPGDTPVGNLTALSHQSLRDQALSALRGAIVMGDIPPGTHLGETRLAENLGISRGTLREAMRRLQQEGLAVTDKRGRLRVREITPRMIREVFQVRAGLEALAARLVHDQPDPAAAIRELRARLDEMERRRDGPILASIDADLDFHRTLCRVSGNLSLLEVWESLEGVLRMSIMYAGPEKARANMSPERHVEVIDAIEQGGAGLHDRVCTHVMAAVDALLGDDGEGPAQPGAT